MDTTAGANGGSNIPTQTLYHKFTVWVSQKHWELSRESVRVITDLCVKQINMSLSNYWPSSLFERADIMLETATCCEGQCFSPFIKVTVKTPASVSLPAKQRGEVSVFNLCTLLYLFLHMEKNMEVRWGYTSYTRSHCQKTLNISIGNKTVGEHDCSS